MPQTWLVTIHLFWAGLGMFLLARRIGIGLLGQIICGLSFALSGYLVSRSAFISINAAVSWIPWLLLSVTWLATGRTNLIKIITTGIVTCMLLLAGHAQIAWYTFLLSTAWLIMIAWQDSKPQSPATENSNFPSRCFKFKYVLTKLIVLLISMGLGVCLAAAQLIPTAELLLQSQRARAVDFDYAMTYSFWPWRFLTLFAPRLFGSPASGDYWGYGNYWEDALYIGVLPLLLAVFVVIGLLLSVRGRRKTESEPIRSSARFNQKSLVIFLVGRDYYLFSSRSRKEHTHLPLACTSISPLLQHFKRRRVSQSGRSLSLVLLAGIGAGRLKRPEGRALYWTRLGTAGAGAITLGAGLAWYLLGGISPTIIGSTALFGLFVVCAGLLLLTIPVGWDPEIYIGPKHRIWEWVLLSVLAFDLILASWNLNPGIEKRFFEGDATSAKSLKIMLANGRLYLNPDDEYELKFNRFMRFDSYSIDEDWSSLREDLLPNINILDGVPSVNNYDPLVSARYARWMDALRKLEASGDRTSLFRILNLMGVSAVEYLNQGLDSGVGFLPVGNSSRIRWVPCVRYARDGDEAWGFITTDQTDFEREVIIESEEGNFASNCTTGNDLSDVTVIDEQPNQIKMNLDAPREGWLVLSDLWYPGWKAEVDGQRTAIFRANYLFRAVKIPAGEHTVIWKYSPASFWIGLVISGLAWIFVGLFWLIHAVWKWRNR